MLLYYFQKVPPSMNNEWAIHNISISISMIFGFFSDKILLFLQYLAVLLCFKVYSFSEIIFDW